MPSPSCSTLARFALLTAALVATSIAPGTASGRVLVGTTDDGNLSIFIPNPSVGLPDPQLEVVSGLPAGARPHGSAIVDVNRGLVADFNANRIFVIGLEPAEVVSVINTPQYQGFGTLAVSPNRQVALASGFTPALTVIRAPFEAGAAQNQIALPAAIPAFATQNIAFDNQGRAYVRHAGGISVIDPPYQSVAFTLPVDSVRADGIAVSPDGSRLLAGYVTQIGDNAGFTPRSATAIPSPVAPPLDESLSADSGGGTSTGLDVFTLPLSATSTATRVELLDCVCAIAGLVITPDSQRALLALLISNAAPDDPVVFSLPAPFTDGSALEILPLPAGFPVAQGFEDIGISADGSEALLVGQSSTGQGGDPSVSALPALHIRAPFTTAEAQLSALNLPGGRGAGSARYAPLGTLPGPPAPSPAIPVPVDHPLALILLGLALLVMGIRITMRRQAKA